MLKLNLEGYVLAILNIEALHKLFFYQTNVDHSEAPLFPGSARGQRIIILNVSEFTVVFCR